MNKKLNRIKWYSSKDVSQTGGKKIKFLLMMLIVVIVNLNIGVLDDIAKLGVTMRELIRRRI